MFCETVNFCYNTSKGQSTGHNLKAVADDNLTVVTLRQCHKHLGFLSNSYGKMFGESLFSCQNRVE